jgi:hypothetical protein
LLNGPLHSCKRCIREPHYRETRRLQGRAEILGIVHRIREFVMRIGGISDNQGNASDGANIGWG